MNAPVAQIQRPSFGGLRSLANCGGCAAKADPLLVRRLTESAALQGLPDPAVLAGLAPYDDAAVYRLDAERALISTGGFFPPLVDDPGDYGAVAAANAVSDVYAMGGEVAFALILSGFPETVPPEVVTAATHAAAAVVADCRGRVLGGHSIHCVEPIFGLSVTGFVAPGGLWRKSGARPGDALMLSKPLGSGLLLSTRRPADEATAVGAMRETNRAAAAALRTIGPHTHAVTDVTGYGLLGHASEVAENSGVRVRIDASRVPLLPGALAAAEAGVRTSADGRTRLALGQYITIDATVTAALSTALFDPQTSGGLLAAVARGSVASLTAHGFVEIGRIEAGAAGVQVS